VEREWPEGGAACARADCTASRYPAGCAIIGRASIAGKIARE
jgi:hypothetical protein